MDQYVKYLLIVIFIIESSLNGDYYFVTFGFIVMMIDNSSYCDPNITSNFNIVDIAINSSRDEITRVAVS